MFMAQDQAFVNAREAAEALGVAERSVRRWISSGLLPAAKRGRSFEIRLVDARRVHERSRGVATARVRDELMELRGRYAEIRERVQRLESELAEERQRASRLEAQLTSRAA